MPDAFVPRLSRRTSPATVAAEAGIGRIAWIAAHVQAARTQWAITICVARISEVGAAEALAAVRVVDARFADVVAAVARLHAHSPGTIETRALSPARTRCGIAGRGGRTRTRAAERISKLLHPVHHRQD